MLLLWESKLKLPLIATKTLIEAIFGCSYDYIFDYTFMLDSSLEVRVSASGYVQGGFYDGNEARQDFGQRMHESTMGGLHDHVINVSFSLLRPLVPVLPY